MSLALWRDISIVWLSFFCFVGLLIPLAVLYFAVRGLSAAQQKVSGGLRTVQGYSRRINQQSVAISSRVAEPVIQAQRQAVRWQAVFMRLWPERKT